jgi:hypothetical protein
MRAQASCPPALSLGSPFIYTHTHPRIRTPQKSPPLSFSCSPPHTCHLPPAGNYSPVLVTQLAAKGEGYADVIYLDAKTDTYLEEVSSCNIFVVKGDTVSTPPLSVRWHWVAFGGWGAWTWWGHVPGYIAIVLWGLMGLCRWGRCTLPGLPTYRCVLAADDAHTLVSLLRVVCVCTRAHV